VALWHSNSRGADVKNKNNAVIQTQQFETSHQSLSVQSILTGHVANERQDSGQSKRDNRGQAKFKETPLNQTIQPKKMKQMAPQSSERQLKMVVGLV
jgi:hypothetical protein